MDRRAFLASLPAGTALLGGCTEFVTDSSDRTRAGSNVSSDTATDRSDADDSDGDDADEQTGFPGRDATVVDFETVPLSATVVGGWSSTADRLSLELDFAEPATADSPALLHGTLENGRSFDQTFSSRRIVVLDDPSLGRDDDRNSVYLVPTANHPLAERVPEYSRTENGRWRVESVGGDWFPETVTLEAEERVDLEYALVGHHDRSEPPIESGTYRFRGQEHEFSIAVWPTDEPGPTERSRFDDAEPPTIADEVGEIAWYHDADLETAVFLRPDVESVAAPARIEFELVNRSRETLSGNPYDWRLYKLVDDDWVPVYPWMWPMPLSYVGPGETDASELSLYHGAPIRGHPGRVVGHLGGGRYAYTVGYSRDEETHAAMFDLEAPALSIDPEPEAELEREDETVVVRLPNHDDARTPSTFTVTRTDSADEVVIEEQLPRRPFRAFRNTLPFFEAGVETVRLKTDRSTALRPVDYDDGGRRTVEYDGEAFEAVGRVLEDEG